MTDQENDLHWREYFYPGSNVLINNFNIKNREELKEVEATTTFERLLELKTSLVDGIIDKNRLNSIHKYIFEDIYPFAGEYRKVNMLKEKGSFLFIKTPNDIDENLNSLFEEINDMLKYCHDETTFCATLARLYTALIFIHPYREGNGRTIREFLREFSRVKSKEIGIGEFELDWSKINKKELNEYIEVAHLFPSSIVNVFKKALVSKEKIIKR